MQTSHRGENETDEVVVQKKLFECSECGEQFKRHDSFRWHKQKHAGVMPFECDECGKSFFRKDHLNRHMRMHTGEKPFDCDICGMKFSQKGHVKPHKLTHDRAHDDKNICLTLDDLGKREG